MSQFISQQVSEALHAFVSELSNVVQATPSVNITLKNPRSGLENSGSGEMQNDSGVEGSGT